MAPVSRSAFRSLVRGLDATEFEQFVADIWRARGWDVEVKTDHVLVATRDDRDGTQTLFVESGSRWIGRRSVTLPDGYDIDAVVVDVADASRVTLPERLVEADVAVIDADELYDLALYAIGRDVCDDLFRTHFDRSVTVEEVEESSLDGSMADPGSSDTARRVGGETGRTRDALREAADALSTRRSKHVIVGAGLALVVLTAGMLGGVAGSGQPLGIGEPADRPTSAPTTTPIPTPTTDQAFHVAMTNASSDEASTSVRADGRSARDEDRNPAAVRGPFPPGMSPSGITDPYVLADAHEAVLTNRSYTWLLTYREIVDGRPSAIRRETVRVEGPAVYSSTVQEVGELRTYPTALAEVSTYANGSVRYEYDPDDPEARYRTCTIGRHARHEDHHIDRSERYIGYFLSVRESTITDAFEEDGKRFYWIVFANDPWPGVENTVGSALIDSTGVVHVIHRRYDEPDREGVSVIMSFRYTDIGTTTVEPPSWHSAAKNATRVCSDPDDWIESRSGVSGGQDH